MKRVVITGGASGMGRAVVEKLSKNGYYVYSLDINKGEDIENVLQIECDITNMQSVLSAFEVVSKDTDKLDAVINFAGMIMMDSLAEMSEEDFVKIFNVNVFGAFRINKAFLPLIINGKGKIIITTSELAARKILPFNAIYAITKKSLDAYAEGLRMELGLLGISVVTIRPGAVKTNLLNKSTDSMEKLIKNTKLYKNNTSKFRGIVEKQQGGTITAEKIANLVYKILLKDKPRLVYTKNANKKLKMLNVVPQNLRLKILKRLLK